MDAAIAGVSTGVGGLTHRKQANKQASKQAGKQFDTEFHKVHTEFHGEIRIALRAKRIKAFSVRICVHFVKLCVELIASLLA